MKFWPSTLPRIAEFESSAGRCSFAGGLRLSCEPNGRPVPPRIKRAAQRVGLIAPSATEGCACRLRLGEVKGYASVEGAYEIYIDPDEIVIVAGEESGWFYALQTLLQLSKGHAEQGGPPCGVIRDAPRFRWRGSMIDSARHFQPVQWILAHLDRMASMKLNRIHWHLADDEAWRPEIRRYPELVEKAAWRGEGEHRYGGYYTQEDMRRVVEYARERFIVVVPEVDMPGHCNAALVAMPELSCGGEPLPLADKGWDAFTSLAGRRAFCAANEKVYTVIGHVLEELAEVFDPPYLHIGGDETPREHWEKCPRCQSVLADIGGTDSADLRVHFLNRIAGICRDRIGLPTIAWTDGVSDRLPRDQIVNAWFTGESAKAARLGYDTINSNHEWTYMDYPASVDAGKSKPAWMITLPLEKVYHFDPMPDGLEAEYADRVLGSEAALWTEHAPDAAAMELQLMPRLAAFAEVLWSPRVGRSYDDFLRRLGRQRASLEIGGEQVAREPLSPADAVAVR